MLSQARFEHLRLS